MEDLKYDFIELTLPNIVGRWEKEKQRQEIKVERCVKPFVEALAKKYPQWRFVATSFWHQRPDNAEAYAEAYRFKVLDGREELGEISTDYGRNHEKVYTIRNERISDSRQRGDTQKTKDLNKAVKTVGKMFGAKTVGERFNEAFDRAQDVVRSVASDRETKFNRGYSYVSSALTNHILEHWEEFAPLVLNKVPQDIAEGMLQRYEEFQITRRIYECFTKQSGAVVLIHGSDYAVRELDPNGQKPIGIFATDSLPPYIKRGVGMLKLVETNHFIKDVGVRISDSAFFIVMGAEV